MEYVTIAMRSQTLLTMTEFKEETKFPEGNIVLNRLAFNVKKQLPVYMTDELIEELGYAGKLPQQRASIKEVLKNNFTKGTDFWWMTKNEYEVYLKGIKKSILAIANIESLGFPDPSTVSNKAIQVVLTADTFKKLCLLAQTTKGKHLRDHFIDLEKFVQVYNEYQIQFKDRELLEKMKTIKAKDDRIDELLKEVRMQREESKKMMKQMHEDIKDSKDIIKDLREEVGVQTEMIETQTEEIRTQTGMIQTLNREKAVVVEERAVRTENTDLHTSFVLVKLNDETRYQYYAIRRQQGDVPRALRALRRRHRNLTVEFAIYQPNAINLLNLLRQELRDKRRIMLTMDNYILIREHYTEEQFFRDIEAIDGSKRDVKIE
jgi:phage anti-repressor protein